MAKVAFVFDEPKTCFDCFFHGKSEYVPDYDANDRLYRKIAECKITLDSVEDPWEEVHWLANNKPEWCPLKPVKEEE